MMKILFVSLNDHVPWGGSEVLWSEAALLLADKLEVAFTVKKWSETPKHIQKLKNAGCLDLRWEPVEKSLLNKVKDKISSVKKIKEAPYSALEKFNPDLVVISLGDHNSGSEWMNRLNKKGVSYVLVPQLVKTAILDERSKRYKDLKKGYLNAKMLCCVSYDNLRLLETQFASKFESVEIVNNPIKNPESEVHYPALTGGVHIACVASLNINHKGHDVVLDVIREEKWQKRNVHIHFYGSGPHEELLQNLINLWGIKNVTLEKFATIDQIWEKNQILLLPSRMEGLSLALLEAFNFERTVLTTDLGDASRFVEDGETGYLLEYPTKELLDRKLEQAWNSRDKWEEMGKKAKQSLKEKIGKDPIEKFAQLILHLN